MHRAAAAGGIRICKASSFSSDGDKQDGGLRRMRNVSELVSFQLWQRIYGGFEFLVLEDGRRKVQRNASAEEFDRNLTFVRPKNAASATSPLSTTACTRRTARGTSGSAQSATSPCPRAASRSTTRSSTRRGSATSARSGWRRTWLKIIRYYTE